MTFDTLLGRGEFKGVYGKNWRKNDTFFGENSQITACQKHVMVPFQSTTSSTTARGGATSGLCSVTTTDGLGSKFA